MTLQTALTLAASYWLLCLGALCLARKLIP